MTSKSESGFSLVELMVGALLTVGLMGAIFLLANRNQQVFVAESGVVDMSQNIRTAIDLMTRDIQSAGMGLPTGVGNLASIFYTRGEDDSPDSIMMLNGDPFAPVADLTSRAAGSAEFFIMPPPDLKITGSGSNQEFTYRGPDGESIPIYQSFETTPARYIVYDDLNAMMFELSANGMTVGAGSAERIRLQHNPTSYLNPAGVFGSPLTISEPDYSRSRIALLVSTVGYRLDRTTGELMRTEDLVNWFSVARGVLNLKIEYRVLLRAGAGGIEERITGRPGWDEPGAEDRTESGELTSRRHIRSVIITIEAETPDAQPGTRAYRRAVHKFEVAPRNLNLVNNNNLSSESADS